MPVRLVISNKYILHLNVFVVLYNSNIEMHFIDMDGEILTVTLNGT